MSDDTGRLRVMLHEAADLACDVLDRVDARSRVTPAAKHAPTDPSTREGVAAELKKRGWVPGKAKPKP